MQGVLTSFVLSRTGKIDC